MDQEILSSASSQNSNLFSDDDSNPRSLFINKTINNSQVLDL